MDRGRPLHVCAAHGRSSQDSDRSVICLTEKPVVIQGCMTRTAKVKSSLLCHEVRFRGPIGLAREAERLSLLFPTGSEMIKNGMLPQHNVDIAADIDRL